MQQRKGNFKVGLCIESNLQYHSNLQYQAVGLTLPCTAAARKNDMALNAERPLPFSVYARTTAHYALILPRTARVSAHKGGAGHHVRWARAKGRTREAQRPTLHVGDFLWNMSDYQPQISKRGQDPYTVRVHGCTTVLQQDAKGRAEGRQLSTQGWQRPTLHDGDFLVKTSQEKIFKRQSLATSDLKGMEMEFYSTYWGFFSKKQTNSSLVLILRIFLIEI